MRDLIANFRWILSFAPPSKADRAWILLLQFLKTAPFYLFPVLVKMLVDQFIPANQPSGILVVLLAALSLGLANVIFHTAYFTLTHAYFIKRTLMNIQMFMVEKLQRIDQSFIDKKESGRLYAKIVVSVSRMGNFLGTCLDGIVGPAIGGLVGLAVLLIVKPMLLLVLVPILPIFLLLNLYFRSKFRENQHKSRIATEEFTQVVNLFIQANFMSRVHGEEGWERRKVDRESQKVVDVSRNVIATTAMFGSAVNVVNQTLLLTVAVAAAIFVMKGKLLVGEMVLFLQYVGMVVNTIANIVNQIPIYTEFREALDAVKEVTDYPGVSQDPEKQAHQKSPGELKGAIAFKGVHFTYEGAPRPALIDVSQSIEPGQTIALVGESGSGKSTFLKLALGLYTPQQGEVYIDGTKVQDLHLQAFRRQLGVVSQENAFFTGKLIDNVTHGRYDGDLGKVFDALRQAHAYDFVMRLPDKLDTRVEEAAKNFSGGQKQRLAIARALYRRPRILVLDEATSALDSQSEAEVQAAIETLLGGQTTLMVAHRLSTVFHADRILVFKEGQIAEQGNHNELIDAKGEYARLLSQQVKLPMEALEALKQDLSHRGRHGVHP